MDISPRRVGERPTLPDHTTPLIWINLNIPQCAKPISIKPAANTSFWLVKLVCNNYLGLTSTCATNFWRAWGRYAAPFKPLLAQPYSPHIEQNLLRRLGFIRLITLKESYVPNFIHCFVISVFWNKIIVAIRSARLVVIVKRPMSTTYVLSNHADTT